MGDWAAASDTELAEGARRGDEEAFAELVRRFQRPLMARALARTRRLEEADDLVQETFLHAWKGLARYRGEAGPGPWLFRILENLVVDRHRRGRREPAAGGEGAAQAAAELADPRPGPQDELVAGELARAVQRALAALPPGRKREIFRLRFVEGVPVGEIAARLGVHSGTVKVHLFRGTRELRRALADWEGAR
ncbi:MAG: RNA polymerase sigma factor [Acidobacteria bacterium]|nr:RNA polymerase sigma factor [Acidobacteriota bacterium]